MNPYAAPLGELDAVFALRDTPQRLQALIAAMTPTQRASSYAPGKWTTAQLIMHLVEVEMVVGVRLRMALTEPHYVVQPFDQDAWMRREPQGDVDSALAAYLGLRAVNVALAESLTPEERRKPFTHPERGTLDVEWLLVMLAGHERHHLAQLETIARQ